MKKLPMIFWGAKGQAKMLYECMQETPHQLVGLFDRNTAIQSLFSNIPVFHNSGEYSLDNKKLETIFKSHGF